MGTDPTEQKEAEAPGASHSCEQMKGWAFSPPGRDPYERVSIPRPTEACWETSCPGSSCGQGAGPISAQETFQSVLKAEGPMVEMCHPQTAPIPGSLSPLLPLSPPAQAWDGQHESSRGRGGTETQVQDVQRKPAKMAPPQGRCPCQGLAEQRTLV